MAFGQPRIADDWFATQAAPQAHDTRQTAAPTTVPTAPVPAGTPAPAPAGTPAPAPAPTGGGGDPFAIMRQAAQGLPPTGASVDPILAALRANGIQATRATHGDGTQPSDDAIVLPDGRVVDMIRDVGGPGAQWGDFSPSGEIYDPSRNVIGPDGKPVKYGSYLTGAGLPVPQGSPAGGPGGQNPAGYGGYDPGYADRLGYNGNLQMDPGFQFRLQQGQQAIERSAAAKGTLLTGGTLKGLTRYAQDYSSNEFQNRYQRLLGEQQNRYTQLYGLSALGQNSAAQQGVQNTNNANQGTNTITDRGNVNAAATIAGSNASNTAIQNSLNQAQQLWLSKLYASQHPGTTIPAGPGNTPIEQNPNLQFFNQ
jgi:hypothetical protein